MKEKVILIKMIQFLMNFIINNKELFLNDCFIMFVLVLWEE